MLKDHQAVLRHQFFNIGAARVGRTAKKKEPFFRIGEIGFDGVPAHVGRQREGVRLKALEGFTGIVFGRGTDVAAFGVQNHRNVGVVSVDVVDEADQCVFFTRGRKVRNLGFKRTDVGSRGVHDGAAEFIQGVGLFLHAGRKTVDVRVKSHAEHGINRLGAAAELFGKFHGN